MIQKLPAHEWLIVSLLIAILLVLMSIAYLREGKNFSPPVSEPYHLISPTISVTITGAVEKPGSYEIEREADLQQLLELAKPLPEADLKTLRKQKKLRDGQRIKVGAKAKLTIYVEGAVEQEGLMQVYQGSRLEDLLLLIKFKPNANLVKIKKKRLLKDQERIYVPVKKEKTSR